MRVRAFVLWVFTACLLCACSEAGAARSPLPAPAEPAEVREPGTLIWWNVGNNYPANFEAGMENINGYLSGNGLFRIDLRLVPYNDLMPALQKMIRSGEHFDLAFTDASSYNQLVNMGAFSDITYSVRSQSPDLWASIPKLLWQGAHVNGRIFAVPTYKDSSQTQYWAFDASYARKYGIDLSILRDMADLDAVFRKMKRGEGADFYPLKFFNGNYFSGIFFEYDALSTGLLPIGVKLDDPTRTLVYTLEQPEVMERLTLLHEWYQDGLINPDARTRAEAAGAPPFLSSVGWPGAENLWERTYGVEEYVSTTVNGPIYTTDSVQGSMNAISADSAYTDEALKLLERINTDHTLRDMLAYGIEGRNFAYESENVVQVLNNDWNVEVFSQGSFFVMSQMSGGPPNQWEQLLAVNESATPSVLMGFMLNIQDIALEMDMCNDIWRRYHIDLLTGVADPAVAVPACMAELKAAGIETIVSEAQKQIRQYYLPLF
ncbi:MAG: ABC transporter substrate-binding protein [Clostridiales bacterium]|jgi:putative aldouronate transport system substrate-binding protein|nr:ABC transporter substrate-binding protein [Clostridiales bacterium]